jgi:hypothetical protein
VAPDAEFSDRRWAVVRGDGYSVEIFIGESNRVVTSVGLFVRGADDAVDIVAALVGALGGKALDAASGTGLFSAGTARQSFSRWQEFKEAATRRSPHETS